MDNYLEKYVLAPKTKQGNGGAGIERHDFHHLVKIYKNNTIEKATSQLELLDFDNSVKSILSNY